jgi:hypothetical protein
MNHHKHHGQTGQPAAETGTTTEIGVTAEATQPDAQRLRPPAIPARRGARLWNALTAAIATVAGIAPHVLHHVGLFAGALLVTGAAGNLLFAALGLVLSIPLLRRLHRRFGTWKAPAVALGVFAVTFSVSAFIIGPAISQPESPPTPPGQVVTPAGHDGHHG